MDALLAELRQVYAEAADFDRRWLVGTVVDTSRYATVGASWVGLLYGDQIYQASYTDGPRPADGTLLAFKRANRHPDSWYFARPLPQSVTAGGIYVSAGYGEFPNVQVFRIMHWDAATNTWTLVGDHPFVGHWNPTTMGAGSVSSRWPIRGVGDRLFAWATPEFQGQEDIDPGVHNAFASDNGGASWATLAITGVYDIHGGVGDVVYASVNNGQQIARSTDRGNTWGIVWASGPGGATVSGVTDKWGRIVPDEADPNIVAVKSTYGVRLTTDAFATLGGLVGPGSDLNYPAYPIYDALSRIGTTTVARYDQYLLHYDDDPPGGWTDVTSPDATGSVNYAQIERIAGSLYFQGEGYNQNGLQVSATGHSYTRIYYAPTDCPYNAHDGSAPFSSVRAIGLTPDGTILAALDGQFFRNGSPDSSKSQFVYLVPGGTWQDAGGGFDLAIQGIDQSSNPGYVWHVAQRDGIASLGVD
jgi:hypothetical protein